MRRRSQTETSAAANTSGSVLIKARKSSFAGVLGARSHARSPAILEQEVIMVRVGLLSSPRPDIRHRGYKISKLWRQPSKTVKSLGPPNHSLKKVRSLPNMHPRDPSILDRPKYSCDNSKMGETNAHDFASPAMKSLTTAISLTQNTSNTCVSWNAKAWSNFRLALTIRSFGK